ncbi:PQQ-dependent sugar dehydrogenase [Nannocystis sp. SCPEA4]|uniref:PQQ-dependent sugar dehydrogenase n=1 Tax=Nannocystis sp. SCPEA4 TaxID=2996787 RepID=UPI00226D8A1D|nr:PQQ-dependent sugar dehydrogenase [Nannocystis sp. SCPEA4]MCY1057177.1 PQQ-dependent sugar dehydrogenase [Nannocystis sp. SCPEA4]
MSWQNFARLTLLPCFTLIACGDNGSGTDSNATTSTDTTDTTATTNATPGTSTTDEPPTSETSPTTTETPPTTTNMTATTDEVTSTTVDPTTDSTSTTTGEPACPYTPVPGEPGFALEIIATGFDRPVLVRADPSSPERLFVVEQGGRIKILEPGETTAPDDSFLDIDVKNKVPMQIGPEQGLLGFDFHPNFPDDPRIYVNYNTADWSGAAPTYVAEFTLDPNDPNKVDPASERLVIAIDQPASNHNGGMIEFGPDGMLYIGMGDGGGADDQYDTGRDKQSLLAKILRIDVEPDGTPDMNDACGNDCELLDGFDYTIPADNPFVDDPEFSPEIYAWGFRNPWRFTFDQDGTFYVADVGQNQWEEVSVVAGGADYGWSLMEGNHCFNGGCDDSKGVNEVNDQGITTPIAEYNHGDGCSITGGTVYRSCEVPEWNGTYFYGDYCSGRVWALNWDGTAVEDLGEAATQDDRIMGSGSNGFGDVLFTVVELDGFNTPVDGKILRVVPQ